MGVPVVSVVNVDIMFGCSSLSTHFTRHAARVLGGHMVYREQVRFHTVSADHADMLCC